MFRSHLRARRRHEQAADTTEAALTKRRHPTGDTATVRCIVAKLEAMPPERARLVASAAYTLARAAHADLDISDDEIAVIEHDLQTRGALDEATAVLVAEMAKLQAKTVGGTEDYVVTREFAALATDQQQQVAMVARLLRDLGRERLDLGRGVGGGQPDRQRARPRPGDASTASAPSSTSSCRRCRPSAAGRRSE